MHVHLNTSLFYGFLIKLLIPKLKLVYHEHGDSSKKFYRFLGFIQFKIDKIIAVSNSKRNVLLENTCVDPNKILVLYNFVDLKEFNRKNIKWNVQKERKELGIKKGELVIGFVGRLAKVKGCEYLIKSLPYLNFPYKVIIAGNGSERQKLERLSKELGVGDKVIFLGYQCNMVNLYSLLDILVMPSLSEASPMAFYEAQAMKIPVIGSNVRAINEFIKPDKNGFLFKLQNSKDLAKKIKKINLDKKMIKNMGLYSYNHIKKYSLTKYLNSLDKLYNSLLNKND